MFSTSILTDPTCSITTKSNKETGSSHDSLTRVNSIIEQFNLTELPLESGLIRVLDSSLIQVSLLSCTPNRTLAAQGHIYYMLTSLYSERPHLTYNYLHRIDDGDDLHILVEGDSVDYYLFYNDGHVEHKILGRNYITGEVPIVTTPGTIASKALKLRPGPNGFAFIVSVVTPEWTPDRCHIGAGQVFVDKYVGKDKWCTEEFLRELIGPNWINSNTTDNQ